MQEYEFILIGVGLDDGVIKGQECNPPPEPPEICRKGVPSFRTDEGAGADPYAETGYIKLKGSGMPEVLGGSRFATEADARAWLLQREGSRFTEVFANVFIARVVARIQSTGTQPT